MSTTSQNYPTDHLATRAVRAYVGEQEIGICIFSPLTLLADDPAAAKIGYIHWLYVEDAYRRLGLARLLMQKAITELAVLGCTDCWLTTTADNWPAQALYYGLGFAVVDVSTSFRKSLSSTAA